MRMMPVHRTGRRQLAAQNRTRSDELNMPGQFSGGVDNCN
jgi:hypothetical protein